MVLGETLKLGYLECAVGGDRCAVDWTAPMVLRNSTSAPVLESGSSFGATLKLSGNIKIESASCKGYVQDEPPVCPLEWTHVPVREVKKEGNMRYQVSKPAIPSQRKRADGKMHLVRTTRIEPQVSRSSSRPSSGCLEGAEKLVVTEADFRRCGNRLTLLRGCKLEQFAPKPKVVEEVKNELELSFRSAFRNRCQSADHPIADPWKDCGNRQFAYEGDHILNQVWVAEASPQKWDSDCDDDSDCTILPSAHSSTSTQASYTDGVSSWPLSSPEQKKQETECSRSRTSSRRPPSGRRAQSLTNLPTPSREVASRESRETREARRESRRESRSRQAGHISGIPKPATASGRGRESSLKRVDFSEKPKAKPKEYESPIRIIDDSEEEIKAVGSHQVRQAIRKGVGRFEKEMDEDNEFNAKPLALWLSLDPLSGQVELFAREAATRLEGAYVNNRTNVPLAGLGNGLDDSIVYLGKKGSVQHPVLKSFTGGQMDVRRLQVRAGAREACVNVVCDHNMWTIVDVPVPGGAAEQRRIVLSGTEMVRPPPPPLPPVDPDRRLYFSNIGADPDHQY